VQAGSRLIERDEVTLESQDRLFNAFRKGKQLRSEFGQSIASDVAFHKSMAETLVEFSKAYMHGGLVDVPRGGETCRALGGWQEVS
jgi:hypothetical protein